MSECFGIFSRVSGFERPMSRRTVTNRRELLLPSLIPDRHQKRLLFDSCVCSAAVAPINGAGEDTSRCGVRRSVRSTPATKVADLELTGSNHLLARLVLQLLRPRNRSGVTDGQCYSFDKPHAGQVPTPAPDVPSALTGQSVPPDGASALPAVETLFTQLARQRLRSRAPKETR